MTTCAHGVHLREDCEECEKSAYAQGRADERAAVVAWLRGLPTPLERVEYLAQAIERGEHEKEKP